MAESPRIRKLAARLYLFLVLLGIFFYFGWSLVYGTWDLTKGPNMAVYAITILLIGFGGTGYLLYHEPRPRPEKANEPKPQ